MLVKLSWTLALSALLMIGCSDDSSNPPVNDSAPDSPILDISQTDSSTPGDDAGAQDTGTQDTGTPAADSTVETTTPQPCDTCHGNPPTSGEHNLHVNLKGYACSTCHDTTVDSNGAIIGDGTHENSSNDVSGSFTYSGGTCSSVGCHGSETW